MIGVLGLRMTTFAAVLYGKRAKHEWEAVLNGLVSTIKMEAVGKVNVWDYPVEGKGGNGTTYFQPITESFIALDTWPDHYGSYLFVCSCRPFDPLHVQRYLAKQGFMVDDVRVIQQGIRK